MVESEECPGNGVCITPNGNKFLQKQLLNLSEEVGILLKFKKEGDNSIKEAGDTEMSHAASIRLLQQKINHCQKLLKIPITKVANQNKICSIGNGVKLSINGKPIYAVLDGVTLCKHKLPENHHIISCDSPLGKSLIGKKKGETGFYTIGGNTFNYLIEKIDYPSTAHWVFSYDKELLNQKIPIETI